MKKTIIGLLAVTLIASPISASTTKVGGWLLEQNADNCALYAHFEGGTTLTVMADRDDQTKQQFEFIVQNTKWTSLVNDATYKLEVEFDDRGAWPITAAAINPFDKDGPGLLWIRSINTNSDGDNFAGEFALSRGIHIKRDGVRVDSLNLDGTKEATMALAKCVGRFASSDPFKGVKPDKAPEAKPDPWKS